jgi:hypothetical protein
MLAWVATATGGLAWFYVGRRMQPALRTMKAHGGHGIVALELAPGPGCARAIVQDWDGEGVAAARASIRLDWWLIPSYVLFGTSLGVALGKPVASVLVAAAGALDVVENVAMLRVLDGHYGAQWPAFGAAAVKWSLLAAAPASLLF